MKAKFIGSGESDPAEIVFFGQTFKLNKLTEVQPGLEAKVEKNSHFEVAAEKADA